jgi:hypothetical protein
VPTQGKAQPQQLTPGPAWLGFQQSQMFGTKFVNAANYHAAHEAGQSTLYLDQNRNRQGYDVAPFNLNVCSLFVAAKHHYLSGFIDPKVPKVKVECPGI